MASQYVDLLQLMAVGINRSYMSAAQHLMSEDLDNVLHTLSPRECGVLRMRYGLDDGVERTLEEIGRRFDVCVFSRFAQKLHLPCPVSFACTACTSYVSPASFIFWWTCHSDLITPSPQVTRERIRQIESKAMRKMRNPARQSMLQDYGEAAVIELTDRSSNSSRRSG